MTTAGAISTTGQQTKPTPSNGPAVTRPLALETARTPFGAQLRERQQRVTFLAHRQDPRHKRRPPRAVLLDMHGGPINVDERGIRTCAAFASLIGRLDKCVIGGVTQAATELATVIYPEGDLTRTDTAMVGLCVVNALEPGTGRPLPHVDELLGDLVRATHVEMDDRALGIIVR